MEKILKNIGWKGVNTRKDICTVVSHCAVCQKLKHQKQTVVDGKVHTLQGSHPMKRVGIDQVFANYYHVTGNQHKEIPNKTEPIVPKTETTTNKAPSLGKPNAPISMTS